MQRKNGHILDIQTGRYYRIASPWDKRVRPVELGPVNFAPLCCMCREPLPEERDKARSCGGPWCYADVKSCVMSWQRSSRVIPSANRDLSCKSTLTEASAASILAMRDWL